MPKVRFKLGLFCVAEVRFGPFPIKYNVRFKLTISSITTNLVFNYVIRFCSIEESPTVRFKLAKWASSLLPWLFGDLDLNCHHIYQFGNTEQLESKLLKYQKSIELILNSTFFLFDFC